MCRAVNRAVSGIVVAVVMLCACALPAFADTWDGGGDGTNWHTDANWADDSKPTDADSAIIALDGVDVTLTTDETITYLYMGETAGNAQTLRILGGTLTAPGGISQIGRRDNVYSHIIQEGGWFFTDDVLQIGGNNTASTGIWEIVGGSITQQNGSADFRIGYGPGAFGKLVLSNSTAILDRYIYMGGTYSGSRSELEIHGSSFLTNTVAAADLVIGDVANTTGVVTQTDGVVGINDRISIGDAGHGEYTWSGGELHCNVFYIADSAGGSGAFNMQNVTLSLVNAANSDCVVGEYAPGGSLNMTDSMITNSGAGLMVIGDNAGALGQLNMTNSSLWLTGAGEDMRIGDAATATGVLNLVGGTVYIADLLYFGNAGEAIGSVSGGGRIFCNGWRLNSAVGSSGTLSMDNGTLDFNADGYIGVNAGGAYLHMNDSVITNDGGAGAIIVGDSSGSYAEVYMTNSIMRTDNAGENIVFAEQANTTVTVNQVGGHVYAGNAVYIGQLGHTEYTISGDGSLTAGDNILYVAQGASSYGTLNVDTGNLSALCLRIANGIDSYGRVTMSSGKISCSGADSYVGYNTGAGGYLHMTDVVYTNDGTAMVIAGFGADSYGEIRMTNSSIWVTGAGEDLIFGNSAGSTGIFEMAGGGTISVADAIMFGNSGRSGADISGGVDMFCNSWRLHNGSTASMDNVKVDFNADTYVALSGIGELHMTDCTFTNDDGAGAFRIGYNEGSCGTLYMTNSGIWTMDAGEDYHLAWAATATAIVNQVGGTIYAGNAVYLGNGGRCEYTLSAGTIQSGDSAIYMGDDAGSWSELTASDSTISAGSIWAIGNAGYGHASFDNVTLSSANGDCHIGNTGTGILHMTDSMITNSGATIVYMGYGAGGYAELHMTNSSIWIIGVGEDLIMAGNAASTAIVEQIGGTLSVADALYIGNYGHGEYEVYNGEIYCGSLQMNVQAGSYARLTMTNTPIYITGAGNNNIGTRAAGSYVDMTDCIITNTSADCGDFYIGNVAGAYGRINMTNSSIWITDAGENIQLGVSAGATAVVNQVGGEVYAGNGVYIGSGGRGEYTLSGGGKITCGDNILVMGNTAGSWGKLTMDSGEVTCPVTIRFGSAGYGELDISGGKFKAEPDTADITVPLGATGTGIVTQTGGDVFAGNSVHIGYRNIGQYTIQAGSLTAGDNIMTVGNQAGSRGILNIEGGAVTNGDGYSADFRLAPGAGSWGKLNISGGSLKIGGGLDADTATGTSLVYVTGSDATEINIREFIYLDSADATMRFTLDDSGVTPIYYNTDDNNYNCLLDDSTLEIDVEGAATFQINDEFTLIRGLEGGSMSIAGVSVVNLDATYQFQAFTENSGGYDYLKVVCTNGEPPTLAAEIDLYGNQVLITNLDVTPSSGDYTDFGEVFTNDMTAITNTFVITNSGNVALYLTGSPVVDISGDSDFTIDAQPAVTNVAGESNVTFDVKFQPTSLGVHTAMVSIANTDTNGNENPYTFLIQGHGGKLTPAEDFNAIATSGWNEPSTWDQTAVPHTNATVYIDNNYHVDITNFSECLIWRVEEDGSCTIDGADTCFTTRQILAAGAITQNAGTVYIATQPPKLTQQFKSRDKGGYVINEGMLSIHYGPMIGGSKGTDDNGLLTINGGLVTIGTYGATSIGYGGIGELVQNGGVVTNDRVTDIGKQKLGTATGLLTINGGTHKHTYGDIQVSAGYYATVTGIITQTGGILDTSGDIRLGMGAAACTNTFLSYIAEYNLSGGRGVIGGDLTIAERSNTFAKVSVSGGSLEIGGTFYNTCSSIVEVVGAACTNFDVTGVTTLNSNCVLRALVASNGISMITASANVILTNTMFEIGPTNDFLDVAGTTYEFIRVPEANDILTNGINVVNLDDGGFMFKAYVTNYASYDRLLIECTNMPISGEMDIYGNGTEISDGDTSPDSGDLTYFGWTWTNGIYGATNTFVITNTSVDPLYFWGTPIVSIIGDSEFTVKTQPASSTLASSNYYTFLVKFNPTEVGTKTATVSIANSDADENPYTFLVRGDGTNDYPHGGHCYWNGEGDGTNWYDGDNWDGDFRPILSDDVRVNMDGSDAHIYWEEECDYIYVGDEVGASQTMTIHTNGSLLLSSSGGDYYGRKSNTYSVIKIDGGTLSATNGGIVYVGGDNTVDNNGTGIWQITSGELVSHGSEWRIGGYGKGLFEQTNGTVTFLDANLRIGYEPGILGQYTLWGGTLRLGGVTSYDLCLGYEAGTYGRFLQYGGAVKEETRYLLIGQNGTGVYDFVDGELYTKSSIFVAYQAGGRGTFNVHDGIVSNGLELHLAYNTNTIAYMHQYGGVVTNTQYIFIGEGLNAPMPSDVTNAFAQYTMTDGELYAQRFYLGRRDRSHGKFIQEGGLVDIPTDVVFGPATNTYGECIVSGGVFITREELNIGGDGPGADTGHGVLTVAGGTFEILYDTNVRFGNYGLGEVNITDGVLSNDSALIYMAYDPASTGIVTQTGGTFYMGDDHVRVGSAGHGIFDISGGTATGVRTIIAHGDGSSGDMDISGGTYVNTANFEVTYNAGAYADVTISGGSLDIGGNLDCNSGGTAIVHVVGSSADIDIAGIIYMNHANCILRATLDNTTPAISLIKFDTDDSGSDCDLTGATLEIDTTNDFSCSVGDMYALMRAPESGSDITITSLSTAHINSNYMFEASVTTSNGYKWLMLICTSTLDYTEVPFVETFEDDPSYMANDTSSSWSGQHNWAATVASNATVQTSVKHAGSKAGKLQECIVTHPFETVTATNVWVDFYAAAPASDYIAEPLASDGVVCEFYINGDGNIVGSSGAAWITNTSYTVAAGWWRRYSAYIDYGNTNWSLYVASHTANAMAANIFTNLAFRASNASNYFSQFEFVATNLGVSYLDSFTVADHNLHGRPAHIDTDGDDLRDSWELAYFCSLTNSESGASDFDGDGYTDLAEYIAGTDPSNASSYIAWSDVDLLSTASPHVLLTWAGGQYTVTNIFAADSLTRTYGIWGVDEDISLSQSLLGSVFDGYSGLNTWTNLNAVYNATSRYYNIRITYDGGTVTNDEYWAMFVQPREASERYMVCVPVNYPSTNNNLLGTLGDQLGRGLYSDTPPDGDRIEIRNGATGQSDVYYWGGDGWYTNGGASPESVNILPGQAMWIVRGSDASQSRTNTVFLGKAFTSSAVTNFTIHTKTGTTNGWTMVGWAMMDNKTLSSANTNAGQLGFWGSGAKGGDSGDWEYPDSMGDNIFIWRDGGWRQLWLIDVGNLGEADYPGWDGRWWDEQGSDFADWTFKPGDAFYYYHNTNQMGTNFVWEPTQ